MEALSRTDCNAVSVWTRIVQLESCHRKSRQISIEKSSELCMIPTLADA